MALKRPRAPAASTGTGPTAATGASVRELLAPDESALARYRRTRPRERLTTGDALVDEALGEAGLTRAEVAGEGAREWVARVVARCAASRAAGGDEQRVTYVDMDGALDLEWFARAVARGCGAALSPPSDDSAAESALDRVEVVQPDDVLEALQAVHGAASRGTRLLVLDSLLSLHWFTALTEPLAAGLTVSFPAAVWRLQLQHGFSVVAIKPALKAEFVSRTWTGGLHHRVTVAAGGSGAVRVVAMREGAEVG